MFLRNKLYFRDIVYFRAINKSPASAKLIIEYLPTFRLEQYSFKKKTTSWYQYVIIDTYNNQLKHYCSRNNIQV